MGPRKHLGFSLIELMVVLTLMAILTGIAAPAVREMMERSRVRNAAFDFRALSTYAKSEAVRRRGRVVMVPVTNFAPSTQEEKLCFSGAVDAVTEWGCGAVVFYDANGDQAFDADDGDLVLRRTQAFRGVRITQIAPAGSSLTTGVLAFNAYGGFPAQVPAMDFTPNGGASSTVRTRATFTRTSAAITTIDCEKFSASTTCQ